MKDPRPVIKEKLKSSVPTIFAATSAGLLAGAIVHHRIMNNGRTLVLPKEAFEALINDETNFVRFTNDKHEHAFRVSLEQWI